jgi:hypothetical protein
MNLFCKVKETHFLSHLNLKCNIQFKMYANVSTIRSAMQSYSGYVVVLSISFSTVVWFTVAAEWYIYHKVNPVCKKYVLISVHLLFGVNIQYAMW